MQKLDLSREHKNVNYGWYGQFNFPLALFSKSLNSV